MPTKKLLSKPCDCSNELFEWKEFKSQEEIGGTKIETSYEAFICKNHGSQWGLKKNEKIIEACTSFSKDLILEENILDFFSSLFAQMWRGKVNIKKWNDKVLKTFKNDTPEKFTNSIIQKGIISKETLFAKENLKRREFIQLTQFGKDNLKKTLGFISAEEQISLVKEKINSTNTSLTSQLNPNQKIILNLLLKQIKKINDNTPGWELNDGSLIVPRNSAKTPPKYLLIAFGICTWLKIYRDNLTLREISARAFQDAQLHLKDDPSKILDKYSQDIDSIIYKFSKKNCVNLGLILTLDSFTFSGEIILNMQDGEKIKISGSSVSFSNLSYGKINTIELTVKRVLFIENFAVFAQLVLDNWNSLNDTLLIFIKGMGVSGHFRKSILKKIINANPKVNYYIWVDYDLGGCNIYREVIKNLEVENIKIIQLLPKMSIPFRKIPVNQINPLKSYTESSNNQLRAFARFILENGKVEQEYLLEWYDEILKLNFKIK